MPPATSTLADTIRKLDQLDLPARTAADLQSAIRCICRLIDIDPGATVASDIAGVQNRLEKIGPEAGGLSPARFSVVRSQFMRALELTGEAKVLRTANIRLAPAWSALIGEITATRQRLALSRFARFCSQANIAPVEVAQKTFDGYLVALTTSTLVRNAKAVHRTAVLAWSQLAKGVAGLSSVEVPASPTAPPPGRHPLASFSASFQKDLLAFQTWCVTADPLDDEVRSKALRTQTVISYTSNLHTAADAAVRSGLPFSEITSIAVLTRADVYRRILRQMMADSGQTATARVHGVATMVVIVAKDWLKLSLAEIAELKKIKAKLPKLRPGLTLKNRELLVRIDDPNLRRRFLMLPDVLWAEALPDKLEPLQRLVRLQMALLIGILQITPLRRVNMCALEFDRHITWPGGPNAPALIQVPAPEMKTEIDYIGELPLDLSRRLHQYRTKLAPAITGRLPKALFVRLDGKPKSQAAVTNRLVLTLEKRLGINMTMHQFRHVSAKLLLDQEPGAYETVAQNLGHTGTKNVVKFYGGTDTRRASRHNGALIERLREEARQRSSTRRKK
ncbi:hypothetical protein [Aestuariivirga sp.]|uniref:hypothetical protein n=1 Tax=Aestuariivirga sp. TaxID=2650926 RepID=UPI003BAB2C1B